MLLVILQNEKETRKVVAAKRVIRFAHDEHAEGKRNESRKTQDIQYTEMYLPLVQEDFLMLHGIVIMDI